jgi:hypothetical protein
VVDINNGADDENEQEASIHSLDDLEIDHLMAEAQDNLEE